MSMGVAFAEFARCSLALCIPTDHVRWLGGEFFDVAQTIDWGQKVGHLPILLRLPWCASKAAWPSHAYSGLLRVRLDLPSSVCVTAAPPLAEEVTHLFDS